MSTLSTLLRKRAETDGARVALSFKERGVWRQLDWARVELVTSSLQRGLGDAGFGGGAVLFVSRRASAHTLLAVLAALSLGGTVSAVDELSSARVPSAPGWAFARNAAELAGLFETGSASVLRGVLFDDQRGASPAPAAVPVLSYSALIPPEASTSVPVFAADRCILEVNLAGDFEVRGLLTRWLTQGFELGVSEEVSSIERDAGELGVSLRIASPQSWDAWADALRARFALPGSRKRRFVEWAIAVNAAPLSRSRLARWVSALLVVSPLRRALRLQHWRRAMSLGAGPSPETTVLLGGLGVRLEPWQSGQVQEWEALLEVTAADTVSSPSAGELARQSA